MNQDYTQYHIMFTPHLLTPLAFTNTYPPGARYSETPNE